MDIREEDPEVTVLRVLAMLRLLKYKPPVDISGQFREGLLEGHKLVRSTENLTKEQKGNELIDLRGKRPQRGSENRTMQIKIGTVWGVR